MQIDCLCGQNFTVSGEMWVLPNHSDRQGNFCPGSFVFGSRNIINLTLLGTKQNQPKEK